MLVLECFYTGKSVLHPYNQTLLFFGSLYFASIEALGKWFWFADFHFLKQSWNSQVMRSFPDPGARLGNSGSCRPVWPDYTIGSNTNPTRLLIRLKIWNRTRPACQTCCPNTTRVTRLLSTKPRLFREVKNPMFIKTKPIQALTDLMENSPKSGRLSSQNRSIREAMRLCEGWFVEGGVKVRTEN